MTVFGSMNLAISGYLDQPLELNPGDEYGNYESGSYDYDGPYYFPYIPKK